MIVNSFGSGDWILIQPYNHIPVRFCRQDGLVGPSLRFPLLNLFL
jgi:hypothetical protein